ncbi:3-ketoacyl-CoA synthase 1-like [Asparagus officinalis]|uniref:3-ketoacyl-CoA synthase 1-like n=1 Tax=Asparagus officinalis TaxID=4686 RepID=UPI00098DE38D|nr:3-ketoacyl-CoA synthase 1-like [Asparagus officinalis]
MAPFKNLTQVQLLKATFFLLLTLTLALHYLLSSSITNHKPLMLFVLYVSLVSVLSYVLTRPRPVFLLDFSCFLPDHDRKCPFEVAEYFIRRSNRFTEKSEEFMKGIFRKSGLGDETYAPPFIFEQDYEAKHASAVQEAEEGIITSVDSLLAKTKLNMSIIDTLVVTCGTFTPAPSLTSHIVEHYKMSPDIKTYNLSGMGCSSGAASIDLAYRILNGSRMIRYILVVITESISLSWYFGDDRSMLVTNCIFRVGTASAIVTNDPKCRARAKFELVRSLRTHTGSDDASYNAAYQAEDEDGNVGVALKKDLVRVAGKGLKTHIRTLAPWVLPWAELVYYAYRMVIGSESDKPYVPDFTTAFEHVCIHTGGKAVIESVGQLMRFGSDVTEPARMCLHRFGNTSSSLVFYELAYFEAKKRIKKGDRVWMLAFGTGFKVCSLVWRALKDSGLDADNPWKDSIRRYPVKSWQQS